MIEQSIVFNKDGSPKEIRFYDDYELVSRLGFISGEDGNFIGTKQLSIEGVMGYQKPRSIFKRKQKVQPDQASTFIQSSIVALMASNDFKVSILKTLDAGSPVSFNVAQLGNADATVYTVPGLRTFYLLGIDLDVISTDPTTSGSGYAYFFDINGDRFILNQVQTSPNRLSGHVQQSFTFKFPPGYALHVFSDANMLVSASFSGVLIRTA